MTIMNKCLLLRTPDREKIATTKLLIYLIRSIPANNGSATSINSADDDYIIIIHSLQTNLEEAYEEKKDKAALFQLIDLDTERQKEAYMNKVNSKFNELQTVNLARKL